MAQGLSSPALVRQPRVQGFGSWVQTYTMLAKNAVAVSHREKRGRLAQMLAWQQSSSPKKKRKILRGKWNRNTISKRKGTL